MTQKIKIIVVIILQTAVFIWSDTEAQDRDNRMHQSFQKTNAPSAFADPVVFYPADSDEARLDIYIEVPIPNIIFERNPSTKIFESLLLISISIQDLRGNILSDKVFNEKISYTDSEMKNEKDGSLYYLKTFYQNPGACVLTIRIEDKNANKEFIIRDTINIKDKAKDKILFSDIMILSDYKTDSEGKIQITPLVNNNVFNLKDFYIFFEIYNKSDTAISKQYSYKIKNDIGKIITEGSFAYNLSSGRNKEFEKLDFFNQQSSKFNLEISDRESGEVMTVKQFSYLPNKSPRRGPPVERRQQGF